MVGDSVRGPRMTGRQSLIVRMITLTDKPAALFEAPMAVMMPLSSLQETWLNFLKSDASVEHGQLLWLP